MKNCFCSGHCSTQTIRKLEYQNKATFVSLRKSRVLVHWAIPSKNHSKVYLQDRSLKTSNISAHWGVCPSSLITVENSIDWPRTEEKDSGWIPGFVQLLWSSKHNLILHLHSHVYIRVRLGGFLSLTPSLKPPECSQHHVQLSRKARPKIPNLFFIEKDALFTHTHRTLQSILSHCYEKHTLGRAQCSELGFKPQPLSTDPVNEKRF